LDFSKAFDRVPHRHLILKLKIYDVRNSDLRLYSIIFIKSHTAGYLWGLNYSSSSVNFVSGVPQGSVLGPLLFSLYANDIPNYVTSTCRLHADDCILYRQIDSSSDANALQNDLSMLEEWEKQWKMLLNIDKCMVLTVTQPLMTSYSLHSLPLVSASSAKYLGMTIDAKLSFNHHIDVICKKTSSTLRRNFSPCRRKIKADLCSNLLLTILFQSGLLTLTEQLTN